MAASLSFCRYCPSAKRENKRTSKAQRRMYHKLLRRISKDLVKRELLTHW